jgi:hypothetical protein
MRRGEVIVTLFSSSLSRCSSFSLRNGLRPRLLYRQLGNSLHRLSPEGLIMYHPALVRTRYVPDS